MTGYQVADEITHDRDHFQVELTALRAHVQYIPFRPAEGPGQQAYLLQEADGPLMDLCPQIAGNIEQRFPLMGTCRTA